MMPAEDSTAKKIKRSYGRGMYDGLRMAGVSNPEEVVNLAKQERLESGLNGIARKVLDCVPMEDRWTTSQVIGEMTRVTGSAPDHRVVQGCLSRLVAQGLVREPENGKFQRIKARAPLVAVPPAPAAPAAAQEVPPVQPAKEVEPMDKLAALSQSMRELAERVVAMAKEVEDVALDVESRIQRIHADSDKLRQLQALLKSIGQ